ncbi:hypothetical protein ACS0TY_012048 [Phlomoides rotata]
MLLLFNWYFVFDLMILLAAFLGIVSCVASKSKCARTMALLLLLSLVVQEKLYAQTCWTKLEAGENSSRRSVPGGAHCIRYYDVDVLLALAHIQGTTNKYVFR